MSEELNPRPPSLLIRFEAPTTHTDGTPIEDSDQLEYRVYLEEGDSVDPDTAELVQDNIAVLHFNLLMNGRTEGKKTVYVTASKFGLESEKSNPGTVLFLRPAAPTILEVVFDHGIVETSVSGSVG